MDKNWLFLLIFFSIMLIPLMDAHASNPNLSVSAENSEFGNVFAGSMVIEVVIRDSNISDTDEGKGEPDVTLNGKTLRMVQATDGNWYAYFANVDKAKIADATVGLAGKGLDFGEFCSRDTATSVFGISLSETDGFAIPRPDSVSGSTNGDSSFSQCTSSPTNTSNHNNVVRNAKSINTNSNIPSGQIGLDADAWPLIQLYSFDDVTIQYNPGGPSQQVYLDYDEIQNISLELDRELYPENSEVFLTLNDIQLNQDPTDEDSWTFNINSTSSTFYQAFDNSGNNDANGNAGLVNLIPHLSNLGFEDNGKLSLNLGNIMELKTNNDQPHLSVSDAVPNTYSNIVTLTEQEPNSGVFSSSDSNDQSIIGILDNAPRGQTGQITYNKESISVVTGSSTASVSFDGDPVLTIGTGGSLRPGTEYPILLIDPDQNLNTGARDDLDVFRDSAIIPTITIGNPITLEHAHSVEFHSLSPSLSGGDDSKSSVPDSNSDILLIDTSNVSNASYEMISINLGISASSLASSLLDSSESNVEGTNWINYDLRSLENELEISDFSSTTFALAFGSRDSTPQIVIADDGDVSSSQGFIQIDNNDVEDIKTKTGSVFLIIDFDSSDTVKVSNESNKLPIVFDFFSFGLENSDSINNSIYRFELEETQDNSSIFEGTFEYAVTNQLNILDPDFIRIAQTIDDEIKIIITDRLIDEEGVAISYADLDSVGVTTTTTSKTDVATNSGKVSTTSTTFRFGQPVTITLSDSDLNLKSDTVEIYQVINDPNSDNVDTIGKDGEILLEIKIKDVRYKRCTINGVEHGGLASTGFTLIETGPGTGIFTGVFKMPSQICDKTGSKLIYTSGGSLDVRYYDSRDASGNANIFSLLDSKSSVSYYVPAKLSSEKVTIPIIGSKEIILTGSIENHKRGIPLSIELTNPDGTKQNFAASLSNSGGYRSMFTVHANTLPGTYFVYLSYDGKNIGILSFDVVSENVPDWVKNNARWWSSDNISDGEFIDGIEHLIETGVISIEPSERSSAKQEIPDWIKNTAKWWTDDQIPEGEFLKSIQYLVKKGIIRI
ncbi:peptidase [Candidatus Nitrosopumilus sp. SW]|uniref:peptidase n=1 Tax=Candidatus Nitrosopumilus sp. SW TaxID=2508726 RepID=UPI00114FE898|nr:peptidase [Candidatus Nitrosopumilus sp. SW]QDI88615.1 peptidase [Candidatus Nitrosopumilus sp. SW]